MTRREIREQIFLKLFQIEFHPGEDLDEQLRYLDTEGEREETKDTEYIQKKIDDIASKVEDIDQIINQFAKGWKTTRMGKVDLALLRLAVYEIRYEDAIPTGVAINEAVELAKKYGTEESPAFINGVLAKIA